MKATGLQTRLKTTGAGGRRVRRSGAGRIKRDAEAGSAAPSPDRLGPSSVSSSARRGPPDRRPDGGWGVRWGARVRRGLPRAGETPKHVLSPVSRAHPAEQEKRS